MKKKLNLLVLSAALTLGLASCGQTPASSPDQTTPSASATTPAETTTPDQSTPTPSASSSSVPSIDYEALAEQAYDQISATYDGWAANGITNDQTIYLESTVGEITFAISYEISQEASAYLKIEGNKLVVTPDAENHAFLGAITVTVKYQNETYYTKRLNVKVNAVVFNTIAEVYSMKKGDAVTTRGKVTALYGTSFFMQDGDRALEIYSSNDTGVAVGDYVEVFGELDIYNGLYELKNTTAAKLTVTKLPSAGSIVDPVNLELTADVTLAATDGGRIFSGTNLYVKAVNLGTGSSGYHYVEGTLAIGGKDSTKTVAMRIDDRYAPRDMLATWGVTYDDAGTPTMGTTVEVGDTVAANGIMSWYNNAQIGLATVTNVTKGEKIVAQEVTIADLYATGDAAIADATLVKVSGKIVLDYNAGGQGFFLADGALGMYIYRTALPDGVAVGDYVSVVGTVDTYNGLKQLKAGKEITKLADHSAIAEPVFLDGSAALAASDMNRRIELTQATLASVSCDGYGNVSGKVTVGENQFSFKFDSRYVAESVLAAAFGWSKTPKESDPTKYDYAITAEIGGKVDIVGAVNLNGEALSITGVSAANYAAPVGPVVTPLSTLEQLWAKSDDDPIRTRGKVTSMYGNSFFIQDGAFGTEVYLSAASTVKVGDYVEVEGIVDIYKGLYEVKPSSVDDITVLTDHSDIAEPVALVLGTDALTTAKNVGGRLFSGSGVVASISVGKDSKGNQFLSGALTVGEANVAFRLDGRYVDSAVLATWGVNIPATGDWTLGETVEVGDTVAINGIISWYDAAQIVVATVTNVEKAAPVVSDLETILSVGADAANVSKRTAGYTGTCTVTVGDAQIKFDNINNGNSTEPMTDAWRMGRKNAESTAVISTLTPIAREVSEIDFVVTQHKASILTSAKAYVSSDGTNWTEAVNFTSSVKVGTVAIALGEHAGANQYYKLEFVMSSDNGNGNIRFSGVNFLGPKAEEGGDPAPAEAQAMNVLGIEAYGDWFLKVNTDSFAHSDVKSATATLSNNESASVGEIAVFGAAGTQLRIDAAGRADANKTVGTSYSVTIHVELNSGAIYEAAFNVANGAIVAA